MSMLQIMCQNALMVLMMLSLYGITYHQQQIFIQASNSFFGKKICPWVDPPTILGDQSFLRWEGQPPPNRTTLAYGQNIVLDCAATGYPTPAVYWSTISYSDTEDDDDDDDEYRSSASAMNSSRSNNKHNDNNITNFGSSNNNEQRKDGDNREVNTDEANQATILSTFGLGVTNLTASVRARLLITSNSSVLQHHKHHYHHHQGTPIRVHYICIANNGYSQMQRKIILDILPQTNNGITSKSTPLPTQPLPSPTTTTTTTTTTTSTTKSSSSSSAAAAAAAGAGNRGTSSVSVNDFELSYANNASNANNASVDIAKILINGTKLFYIKSWTRVTIGRIGYAAILRCRIFEPYQDKHQTQPTYTLTWKDEDGISLQKFNRFVQLPTGDLLIKKVKLADYGSYRCILTTNNGISSIETLLYPMYHNIYV